eukprot:1137216-Pelagomonas_calceolata.AAC.4
MPAAIQLQQCSSRVAALLLLVEVYKTHNPIFFRSSSYFLKSARTAASSASNAQQYTSKETFCNMLEVQLHTPHTPVVHLANCT